MAAVFPILGLVVLRAALFVRGWSLILLPGSEC